MRRVLCVVYGSVLAALAVIGGLLILLYPFSPLADDYLQRYTHKLLPISLSLILLVMALFVFFCIVLARRRKWVLQGKNRLFHVFAFVLALLLDAAFLMLVYTLVTSAKAMGEMNLFIYRAMEFIPLAGMLAVLALLLFVLPWFRCWGRVRWRVLAFFGVVTWVIFLAFDPRPPKIVAGPWLQLAEPGEMTVCWITNAPSTGWVEYGNDLSMCAHASQYGLIDAMTHIHRVTMKGLTPGTTVRYRVAAKRVFGIYPICARFGASMHDAAHTFHVPDPSASTVSFVVISDLHDCAKLLPQLAQVTDIKKRDFVVFNGDTFTHVNNEYQIISHLLRPASKLFAAEVPFVFVRGNHEARGAYARHLHEYISLPGGHPYLSSFRVGPASFLVVDTGEDKPDDHVEYFGLADFTAWRAEELQMLPSLVSTDLWKSSSFQLLLAHIPGFSASGWNTQLNSAGIDLHIAGHFHGLETMPPPSSTNSLGSEDRRFPIQVISGDARGGLDEYVVGIVTVTPENIAVKSIDGNGKVLEQKTFPPVEAINPK